MNHLNDIPACTECTTKNNVFCRLSHDEKQTFSFNKGHNLFKKGKVIFYEGNHPTGIYCVFEGQIKISKLGDGKEQIVRFASKGEILGYRALLSNEPYRATATAMDDCLICHIPRISFFEVLESNKTMYLKVIEKLSGDLKNSEQRLVSISQKTVRERIAEALLLLKEQFGMNGNSELDINLTRREIGDIAGVATETTIRTLSELKQDKVIEFVGKKIIILDLPRLIEAANLID